MQRKKEVFELAEELRKEEINEKKRKLILKNIGEGMEKEKTMKLSVKEGTSASVMTGFGNSYITPYALALNANNAQIGFLSSFVGLVSPLSQIFGSKLMEKFSRKKIIVTAVTLHALMWIPVLVLTFLFSGNILKPYLPILLIIIYSILAIFGSIAGPSWFSLMGDIVPEKIRGRYFGKRNRVAESVALISFITAAFLLDFFKTKGLVLVGFSLLFSIACMARLISVFLFKKHYEPKFRLEKGYYFPLWQFIKKAYSNNFGRFVIFVSLIHFATAIAGPFFAVYMLKDLNFSYTAFMLVNVTSSLASLISMPIWGKFSDKYGNRELLRIGSILIPLFPILWLFSKSPYYLAFVPQLIGGLGWAAFNLGASNFIYDSVSIQRRGLCVAYFNVLIGIGVFLGASLGGLLAHYLTIAFMNKLLFIFLISGILRFVVVLIALPLIKEIRHLKKPKSNPFFYFKEIMPMKGMVYGIVHNIAKIKDNIGSIKI